MTTTPVVTPTDEAGDTRDPIASDELKEATLLHRHKQPPFSLLLACVCSLPLFPFWSVSAGGQWSDSHQPSADGADYSVTSDQYDLSIDSPAPPPPVAAFPPTDTSRFIDRLPFRVVGSSVTAGWLSGGGSQAVDMTELDVATNLVTLNPFTDNAYFSLTPRFGWQQLDLASGDLLPADLYQVSAMFAATKAFSETVQMTLGIAPGYSSDGNASGSDAFRISAVANIAWQKNARSKWLVGVAATGRDDLPVLPFVGWIGTPNDNWRIELTAPRPRLAYRLIANERKRDHWLYLAGEFGGGSWAVDHNGQDDLLTLRDFRLITGWEAKREGLLSPKVEFGYVFGRVAEYDSGGGKRDFNDAFLFRAGVGF